MEILYLSLNILDIRCDGSANTKNQCDCISTEIPSKREWLGKKKRKQQKGCYRVFIIAQLVY